MKRRTRIFISYVRSDAEADAGRLADALRNRFRASELFIDTECIELGANWRQSAAEALADSVLLLMVMGPNWKPSDPIGFEIATAAEYGVPVLPIAVRGADIAALTGGAPEPFRGLGEVNGLALRHQRWHADLAPLVRHVEAALAKPSRARAPVKPPHPPADLAWAPGMDERALLDLAGDLADRLRDPSVLAEARAAARAFDDEFARRGRYRSDGLMPPRLASIVDKASKRVRVEKFVRELCEAQLGPRDAGIDEHIDHLAACLGEPAIGTALKEQLDEFRAAIDEYRRGGGLAGAPIVELQDDLLEALQSARARLAALVPGITTAHPKRRWPAEALAAPKTR